MIAENLRKNYGKTRIILAVCFVFAYIFAHWHDIISSSLYVAMAGELFAREVWFMVIVGVLSALLMYFITPPITRIVIGRLRLYYLPQYEFGQLMVFIFTIKNTILGVLCLTYLISPAISVWGGIVYPLIATTLSSLYLFKIASKHYLNSSTAPRFFSLLLLFYAVYNGAMLLINLFAVV